jgi:hypothetical protein
LKPSQGLALKWVFPIWWLFIARNLDGILINSKKKIAGISTVFFEKKLEIGSGPETKWLVLVRSFVHDVTSRAFLLVLVTITMVSSVDGRTRWYKDK